MNRANKIDIKRNYIIAFIIINFLIIGLYYAYGIFTIKQLKDDISRISIKSDFIKMTINNNEENSILVKANEKIDLTFDIENLLSRERYYRIVHKGVPSGVMIYEKDDNNNAYGMLEANGKSTIVVTVDNTTGNDINIIFDCEESSEEKFDKDIGYSYINHVPNYDHSGANRPVYEDNMIPVYYDASNETEGVWKKANSENNDTYMWYDYDNFMWANVVTVNSESREKYQNAEPGTEILDSDINAFFVWIPKYKYYVINNDNTTTLENLINVDFVGNRIDILEDGTVNCIESIANKEDKHLYSEICSDEKYGQIYNNLSTYTHPAFKDVNGFWIGKYANNNTTNISIKPNTLLSVKTDFKTSNVRKMQQLGNVYGFSSLNNYDEKTWKYNSDGNLVISPIDSMEWGALAILTNSLYGKSGNPMYQTTNQKSFTRVYNNLSDSYSGRSTNYTSSSVSIKNNSVATVYYNDLTNVSHKSNMVEYPIGYRGAGASTTGTIYGVYDMSGGTYTTVMGIVMNEDGTTPYEMDNNFYTAYSYIPYKGNMSDAKQSIYLEVFRLGDGIKEHVRTFSIDGMWQDGRLTFSNTGVMRRGGYTSNGSIFTTEVTNDTSVYGTFTILKYKSN